jgi:hypothetical protein
VTTFDDYIKCKGIDPNKIYTPSVAAQTLGVHRRTVENYMWVGRKTAKNGVIGLHYHITVKGCEIIGKDLIEFLRLTHMEGGE